MFGRKRKRGRIGKKVGKGKVDEMVDGAGDMPGVSWEDGQAEEIRSDDPNEVSIH